MTDKKVVLNEDFPEAEQEKWYKILVKCKEKAYSDGSEVEIQREEREVTEAFVDNQIAYWQDIKDQITALK